MKVTKKTLAIKSKLEKMVNDKMSVEFFSGKKETKTLRDIENETYIIDRNNLYFLQFGELKLITLNKHGVFCLGSILEEKQAFFYQFLVWNHPFFQEMYCKHFNIENTYNKYYNK